MKIKTLSMKTVHALNITLFLQKTTGKSHLILKNIPFTLVAIFFFWGCGNAGTFYNRSIQGTLVAPSDSNLFLIRVNDTTCIYPLNAIADTSISAGEIVDVLYNAGSVDFHKPPKDTILIGSKKEWLYKTEIKIRKKMYNDLNFVLGWLQMTISLFVICITFSVWIIFHSKNHQDENLQEFIGRLRKDRGVIYINLALFFWAAIGLIQIYAPNSGTKEIMVRIFSISNNLLFVLSFPHFNHSVNHFKRNKWLYDIVAVLLSIVTVIIFYKLMTGDATSAPALKDFDILYSVFVLATFGYILHRSFSVRKFKLISKLAVLLILGAILAQISPHITGMLVILGNFQQINYYTTFVMITTMLVALMFSWYNEQRENAINESYVDLQAFILDDTNSNKSKNTFLSNVNSKGEIELVLNALFTVIHDQNSKNELVIIRSNFIQVKKDFHLNKINYSEYMSYRSKYCGALQEIIDKKYLLTN